MRYNNCLLSICNFFLRLIVRKKKEKNLIVINSSRSFFFITRKNIYRRKKNDQKDFVKKTIGRFRSTMGRAMECTFWNAFRECSLPRSENGSRSRSFSAHGPLRWKRGRRGNVEREPAILSRLEKKRLTVNTRIIRVLPNKVLRFRSPLFQTSYTLWHMSHMKTNDVVKQTAERIRRKAGYLFTFGLFSPLPLLSFSPLHTTRFFLRFFSRALRPTVVAVRLGRRFVTQVGKQVQTHIPPENSGFSSISLSLSLTNHVLLIRRMSDRQVRYCFFLSSSLLIWVRRTGRKIVRIKKYKKKVKHNAQFDELEETRHKSQTLFLSLS